MDFKSIHWSLWLGEQYAENDNKVRPPFYKLCCSVVYRTFCISYEVSSFRGRWTNSISPQLLLYGWCWACSLVFHDISQNYLAMVWACHLYKKKKSRSTLQCTIQINKTGNDSHQINSRQFHVIPLSSSQPNADSLLAVSKYSTPSYMTAKHTWSPSQP